MKEKKGFTLLIAIVVTSMLLIVSFVVVNVAVKQLVLANSNQESQYAFYNADTGTECAVYWDFRNGTTAFDPASPTPITCKGTTVTPVVTPVGSTATTSFTINLNRGCVTVNVGKYADGTTIIDSKGYNTCTGGATRKLERGEKLSYTNAVSGGGGGSGILGINDPTGSATDSGDANYLSATKFTMPVGTSGTAVSISVYIPNPDLSGGNNSYKVAIYGDSAGLPGSLLAQSAVGTLVTGWNTLPISLPLSANTTYWLTYNANSPNGTLSNYNISPGSAGQWAWRAFPFASSFPASFGTLEGNPASAMIIYATYSIP